MLDPKVREKYEKLVPIVWLHLDLALILKIGAVRFEKFRKDAGERREMLAECRNPEVCAKIARRVVLDQTLLDEEWLRGATGLGHAEFFYLVGCFEDAIRANPGSPLFRNGVDEARKSCRGNRCSLATEHMLCMVLYHMWTGCAQDALQGTFGVDQSTASRNIRMVRDILANSNILPTDRTCAGELTSASPEEAEEAVGDTLHMDWTNVKIEKPVDRDSNNEAYSVKAGTTTAKMMAVCGNDGVIRHRGPPLGGRDSEIEYLRQHPPNLGHVTASLTNPDTPPWERITVNFDGGPRGAHEVFKGADVRMPYRKPPGGELTGEQKAYNSRLAGERAIIENRFADIKSYRILGNVFRGSVHDLDDTFSVVTGLSNLKLMMRRRRGWTPDTHRKRLKPGPKKPGPKGRKPRATFGEKPKKKPEKKPGK